MLVLSRKPGEKVTIGDGVEIVVLKIEEKQVKIGFVAPKEVLIMRSEVDRRI